MNTVALDYLVEKLEVEEVEYYFTSNGWLVTSNEFTIQFSKQGDGKTYPTLEIAASRKFADYDFRLRQVIEGLSIIEDRPALDVFVDMLRSPEEIIVSKLEEYQLKLNSQVSELALRLEPVSFTAAVMKGETDHKFGGKYVSNVAATCDYLASEGLLEGALSKQQICLLEICSKLLAHAYLYFWEPVDEDEFWKAATSNASEAFILSSIEIDQTSTTNSTNNEPHAAAED